MTPKTDALEKPKPLEVPIAIPDPVVSEQRAIEAMKKQGAVEIQASYIRDMADIGIHVKGTGVLKIQRGKAMVNQHRLERTMNALMEFIDGIRVAPNNTKKLNQLTKAAGSLGMLSSKLTESQKLMVDIEGTSAPGGHAVEEAEVQNRGFAAGQDVKPPTNNTLISTNEVHIHNPPNGHG